MEHDQFSPALEVLRETVRPRFEYDIKKLIGYGKDPVYLAIRRDTGQEIAVKKVVLRTSNSGLTNWDDIKQDFERSAIQFIKLAGLNHPNVVQHLGLELEVNNLTVCELALIMEYCSGGTLLHKSQLARGLPEAQVKLYARQLIEGLVHIHAEGICHLDIKGANIFLAENDTIKIGDFGDIVMLESASRTRTDEVQRDIGTLRYNAPEMVSAKHAKRGRAADIYSFGCVLVEMLTGQMTQYKHPTLGYLTDRWDLATFIANGGGPEVPSTGATSKNMQQLLKKCLNATPGERPFAQQLQQNSYLTYPNSNARVSEIEYSEPPVCDTEFEATHALPSYMFESDNPTIDPWVEGAPSHVHKFAVQTFSTPTKCVACSSLMVGLVRQGYRCGECQIHCHTHCTDQVPKQCPPDRRGKKAAKSGSHNGKFCQLRDFLELIQNGESTAFEGFLRVPKVGGLKKGWIRVFVAVCDYKLFLYELLSDEKGSQAPGVVVSQVLDMRDEDFSVSLLSETDVIHANKHNIPRIFKVRTSVISGIGHETLMLAETKLEKMIWTTALMELLTIMREKRMLNLLTKAALGPKALIDKSLNLIKSVTSAAIIDQNRLVVGTDDGLFCIDLQREEVLEISGTRNVARVEYIVEEQLLIIMSGKEPCIRQIHTDALTTGQGAESIELTDTKGCKTFCVGQLDGMIRYVVCVAMKRHVLIYEITCDKERHRLLREIKLDLTPQCLDVRGRNLFVGFSSAFRVFSLSDNTATYLNAMDLDVFFWSQKGGNDKAPSVILNALMAIDVSEKEYLLIFSCLGIYLDGTGRMSKSQEIMFTAPAIAVAFARPNLLIYTDNYVAVYDVISGDWIQTINHHARPLCGDGSLNLVNLNESPMVVYFRDLQLSVDRIVTRDSPAKEPIDSIRWSEKSQGSL